jgi:hypothetical protein
MFTFIKAVATAIAILVCSCATTHAASKPLRIDVMAECEANTACILAPVEIADFKDEQYEPNDNTCGRVYADVRGRLNGGAAKIYRVSFATGCVDCGNEGYAALTGYSPKGHPLVQTRAGLLEIMDRKVAIGQSDALLLIHAQTGKIVAKYWGTSSSDTAYFFKGGRVYIGDGAGSCIVAPRSLPQSFTRSADGCRESDDLIFVQHPTPAMMATIAAMAGTEERPNSIHMYSVAGTELIATTQGDPCH